MAHKTNRQLLTETQVNMEKIFMVGIKTMEIPSPTMTLPIKAIFMVGANPKIMLPAEAMSKKKLRISWGPMSPRGVRREIA